MASSPTDFERRMRPFIMLQAAVVALGGFAGVFVHAEHGSAAVARYAAVMLVVTAASNLLAFALGRFIRLPAPRVAQAGFALPAVLLWWADGRPDVLAVAFGGFLGLTWAARHWLEMQLLADEGRDAYAAHVIALAVGVALVSTLAVSTLLAGLHEARRPVYGLFALLCTVGTLVAGRRLPEAPPVRLEAFGATLRQPTYVACLPLLLLEGGLFGVSIVLTASGAVHSLDRASHYGWVASVAALLGALALRSVRRHRHSENRVGWMRAACIGVVLAASLLGASALWPALFVLHLLLQAAVNPFWVASEHVLNQRVLDLHGAVGDRIAAREGTLGVFRLLTLGAFWFATMGLDDRQRLVVGAAMIAFATVMEYRLGRGWLAASPSRTATT